MTCSYRAVALWCSSYTTWTEIQNISQNRTNLFQKDSSLTNVQNAIHFQQFLSAPDQEIASVNKLLFIHSCAFVKMQSNFIFDYRTKIRHARDEIDNFQSHSSLWTFTVLRKGHFNIGFDIEDSRWRETESC